MSDEPQNLNADPSGLRFAIVVARFNQEITKKLLEGAQEALEDADVVDVFYVPGAFELPLAALKLTEEESEFEDDEEYSADEEEFLEDLGLSTEPAYDAIVALGCVIRGETPHFEYVAREAARGLQDVALRTGIPVAFGVLTTDTLEQARERAGGKRGNKGYDAAMTAIEMARFPE